MVEWKKLGEVCRIFAGGDLPKNYIKGNKPMGVFQYPIFSNGIEEKSLYGFSDTYRIDKASITISARGTIGYHTIRKPQFTPIVRLITLITKDNQFLNLSYLNEVLYLTPIDGTKGGIPQLTVPVVSKIEIPVPSLEEQNRIVGILDTFTDSIENLKQQIAQRRKQYEHYRDQLLDLEGKEGVEMKCITDIAQNYTGLTYKPENVSNNGTLVLRSSNIEEDKLAFKDNVFVQMDNIPQRAIAKQGDILICVRNGSKRLVGKAAMITKEADGMAFGAFMTVLRTATINSKYLFYLWQSEKVKKQYKGDEAMPIAQITSKDFKRIIVPIISLEAQSRIVSILDTFEASISNLEAQLEQRQKQYEYYRNQLLTFE